MDRLTASMLTGPELRRMREAAGLMRRELADLLGLPVVVVKLAEAGRVGSLFAVNGNEAVFQGQNSVGMSRQGAPVRNFQRIASMISRPFFFS
jgi:transcriptional regulator with XRE-family HTH domain